MAETEAARLYRLNGMVPRCEHGTAHSDCWDFISYKTRMEINALGHNIECEQLCDFANEFDYQEYKRLNNDRSS